MTTSIFIGDPHFQVGNIPEVDIFLEKITKLAEERKPDFIVIGGDILHTHERLHTTALNKAYELVDKMRKISYTYVLVGNHDLENNQQFLTERHWMNGMKEWENVSIVDKTICNYINNEKFVFVPYVPPGRFQDALNVLSETWSDASCIFAHQEFAGCKMGAIVSVEGDKWPEDYPEIISGHIHSRQIPQPNIYYTGSAMQHAFGESEKNIIACLTFNIEGTYEKDEVDLCMPRKKIIYKDVKELEDYVPTETEDKVKVTVSGEYEEFKALKKTKKYKQLIKEGVKVVFKPKKIEIKGKTSEREELKGEVDFRGILDVIVNNQADPYLTQAFELVLNGKETNTEDVIFL